MVEPKEEKIYKKLSLVYHYLMRSVSYEDWAKYIYRLVAGRIPKHGRVLELGQQQVRGILQLLFPEYNCKRYIIGYAAQRR